MSHEHFMREALADAREAFRHNEFPVGCVIEYEGGIVARGRRRNSTSGIVTELDHAEIVALRALQQAAGAVDLTRATLYSTMEPCLMCYATLLLNRVKAVVYAYEDVMSGCTGLAHDALPPLYRDMRIEVVPHVLRSECLALFKEFFRRPSNEYWRGSLLADYTLAQE